MTILTKQQLKDQRNLTDTFIRKHDREMGGRGKPRRYDLALVDDFLFRYFREELQQRQAADRVADRLVQDIDSYISTARAGQTGSLQMVGRGGTAAKQEASR